MRCTHNHLQLITAIILQASLSQYILPVHAKPPRMPQNQPKHILTDVEKFLKSDHCNNLQGPSLNVFLQPLQFSVSPEDGIQYNQTCNRPYPWDERTPFYDAVDELCALAFHTLQEACAVSSAGGGGIDPTKFLPPAAGVTLNEVCSTLSGWVKGLSSKKDKSLKVYGEECNKNCVRQGDSSSSLANKDCYALYQGRKLLEALKKAGSGNQETKDDAADSEKAARPKSPAASDSAAATAASTTAAPASPPTTVTTATALPGHSSSTRATHADPTAASSGGNAVNASQNAAPEAHAAQRDNGAEKTKTKQGGGSDNIKGDDAGTGPAPEVNQGSSPVIQGSADGPDVTPSPGSPGAGAVMPKPSLSDPKPSASTLEPKQSRTSSGNTANGGSQAAKTGSSDTQQQPGPNLPPPPPAPNSAPDTAETGSSNRPGKPSPDASAGAQTGQNGGGAAGNDLTQGAGQGDGGAGRDLPAGSEQESKQPAGQDGQFQSPEKQEQISTDADQQKETTERTGQDAPSSSADKPQKPDQSSNSPAENSLASNNNHPESTNKQPPPVETQPDKGAGVAAPGEESGQPPVPRKDSEPAADEGTVNEVQQERPDVRDQEAPGKESDNAKTDHEVSGDDDISIGEPQDVYKAPPEVSALDRSPGLAGYAGGSLPAQGGDSNFFAYFLTAMVLCIVLYLAFHNKQKILALIIEGRSSAGRRRPHSSQYRRLDNSLEEAISSQQRREVTSSIVY